MTDRKERYLKILEAAPHNHLARFGLANTWFEEGRFEEAAGQYRMCLETQADWMAVRISLGHCLVKLARWDEARLNLDAARRLAQKQGHSQPIEEIDRLLSLIP